MARMLITVMLAYVFTRLGYMLAGYQPIQDHGIVLGTAIDFSIWLAVCTTTYVLLGMFPRMRSKQA